MFKLAYQYCMMRRSFPSIAENWLCLLLNSIEGAFIGYYKASLNACKKNYLPFLFSVVIFFPLLSFSQLTGGTVSTSLCQTDNAVHQIIQTATITGEDGFQPIVYSWERSNDISFGTFTTVGGNTISLNDNFTLTGTTYYRRRVDNAGSFEYSNIVTIHVKPKVTGVNPAPPQICLGQNNFLITLTSTQSPDQYKIDWGATALADGFSNVSFAANNLPVSGSINVAVPNTAVVNNYSGSLTVKNSTTTCESDPGASFFIINPLPTISITPSATAITLGMTATLTASGADTYAWIPTATLSSATGTTVTASPTITTMYTVTGTVSATGCINTASVTITVNPVLTGGVIASSQSICINTTPTGITSTSLASGGTGTITYQWEHSTDNISYNNIPGATAITYSPGILTQTTYYKRGAITSVDAVVYSNVVTITVNALPIISITPSATAITLGMTATLTASGADTYAWIPTATLSSATGITVTASPTVTTTYTVTGTVSATGCVNTASISITIIDPGVIANNQEGCGTYTPASFLSTADASGAVGITYQWLTSTSSDFSSGVTIIIGASANTYAPSSISVTTYYKRVANFNGNSFNSNIISATVKTIPVPTIGSNSPVCVNGTLGLNATGGNTYSWTGPNGFTSATQNPAIPILTTAAGGTYGLTVTAANGCSTFTTTTIVVNTLPTINITPNAATILAGQTASLTASGASTYSWSPSIGLSATNTATVIAGPLSNTTTYIVTGTVTATGCINTGTVTVTIASINPGVIGSDQTNCGAFTPTTFTETITASGATPITYQWQSSTDNITFNNIVGETATTYTSGLVTATTYYRRVASYNGSSFNSNSIFAMVNPFPVITAVTNSPICVNGNLNLNATGGGTYSWIGPNGFASAIQNPVISAVTTAVGGTYSLTVTSVSGCSVFTTTVVTVNTLPGIAISPAAATIAANGNVSLTSSGANTYSWAPSTNLSSATGATVTASPTLTTIYTVIGTLTATGCINSASITITVYPVLTAGTIASAQSICANTSPATLTSSSNATGGLGSITYQWQQSTDNISYNNIGGATSATYTPGVLTQTTYYRRGAFTGADAIVFSNFITITVNALPTASISASGPISFCSGGSVNLTGGGGVSYLWNNGSTSQTIAVNNSVARSVTVTDANGCSSTSATTNVTVNPLPNASITASGPTNFCLGGSVNLTASGGVTYVWNNGATTASINVNSNASRMVTVTDANGCLASSVTTNIVVYALPIATITANGPLTFCTGGSVNLTATGGLSYLWNNGANTPTINVNTTTSRSVTVTDANGCVASSSITNIVVNNLPTANIVAAGPTSFCSGGSVNLSATGGLSYLWNTGATSANINVTTAGIRSVTVTDANGCIATSAPVNITLFDPPQVTINDPLPVCSPGTVDITVAGITAGTESGLTYSYWLNAPATLALNSPNAISQSNTFYIKAISAAGCSTIKPVTVVINQSPVVTITNPPAICANGSIDLGSPAIRSGSNGTNNFSYWRDAAATNPLTNHQTVNQTGTYYVKGTTDKGCSDIKPVTLLVNPQPDLIIHHPSSICSPATVNLLLPAITAGSSAGTQYTYWNDASLTIPLNTPSALTSSGTFYIKGVLPTGCFNSAPVIVTILNTPSLAITNPAAICAPATIDLTSQAIVAGSTNGLLYSYWQDAANTLNIINPSAINTSGTYYIKGIGSNGCASSLAVIATIHPLPNGILQDPIANFICQAETRDLKANNAFAYQWYRNQTLISGANNDTYAATIAGNYTVRFFTDKGCFKDAEKTIRLDVLTKPIVQFVSAGIQCISLPINFTNQSSFAGSGSINWQWDFGDGTSSNAFSPAHTYQQPGTYSVVLSANNQSCSTLSEKITTVIKVETPTAGIRYATLKAVKNKPLVISARTFGTAYTWTPSLGLNNPQIAAPTATLLNDIEYTVQIRAGLGCITTDTVAVQIENLAEIFVAQAFTPNGDGLNDKCFPQLVGIRSLTYFKIINRWGNLVFQTKDATPQNGWDGKLDGIRQSSGAFTWMAEGIDGEGNVVRRNGTILLIN